MNSKWKRRMCDRTRLISYIRSLRKELLFLSYWGVFKRSKNRIRSHLEHGTFCAEQELTLTAEKIALFAHKHQIKAFLVGSQVGSTNTTWTEFWIKHTLPGSFSRICMMSSTTTRFEFSIWSIQAAMVSLFKIAFWKRYMFLLGKYL